MFFGISLILSAVYYAFLRSKTSQRRLLPVAVDSEAALFSFMHWTFSGVLSRAWALRGAIVALGGAALVMPVPFVINRNYATIDLPVFGVTPTLVFVAFTALTVWILAEIFYAFQTDQYGAVPDPLVDNEFDAWEAEPPSAPELAPE